MKTFKSIIALTVLMFATSMFADTLVNSETLADGTVIPAGSEMIVGDNGVVQYKDSNGVILASVKVITTSQGPRTEITKRIADGSYVLVVVSPTGATSTTPTPAPTAVTPATGGTVGGSVGTQGPSGTSIPNNPATVI